MKNKYLSLPIERFEIEDIDDDLAKIKIYVMHDGKNLNDSNFSKVSIENAKESIKNKPLIGVVEKDKFGEKDFKGHEIEYKIVKKNGEIDLEIIYIEQPLGLVPETNNYHYETIDNQEWVVIDAYIWKEYCREAYDILQGSDKTVSMEIKILSSHTDEDDEFWIDEYKYTGITLLGDSHNPAMGDNATISLYESNKKNFVSSFEKISNEINKYINKNREEFIMPKLKNEKFEMSIAQMEDFIREELKKKTYIYNNYWGESREGQKYYLQDILVNEKICIVVDDETWGRYYGIPYSFSGDVVTLDYDNIKRYVIGDWREMTDGQTDKSVEVFESIKTDYDKQFEEFETKIVEKTKNEFDVKKTEEYTILEKELNTLKEKYSTKGGEKMKDEKQNFETLKTDFNEIKTKFEVLEKENERLKKFEDEKLTEERKEKEIALFTEYAELEKIEGFKEIKENASKHTIEELDTKLAVLFAKTIKANKKFSVVESREENGNVKIPVSNDKKESYEENLYGGLFEKYSDK